MSNRLTSLLVDNGYRYGLLLYPWHFSGAIAVKCFDHPKIMVVTRKPEEYSENVCDYNDYTKILSFINGVGKRLLFVDDVSALVKHQKSKDKPYSEYMTVSENHEVQVLFATTTGVTPTEVDTLASIFSKMLYVSVMTDLPAPGVEPLSLQLALNPDAVMMRLYTIMKLNPEEQQHVCALDVCYDTKEGIPGMIDILHLVCTNDTTTKELISLIRKCLDTSKGIRQNDLSVYIYHSKSFDIDKLVDSYYSTVKYFDLLLDKSIRAYYNTEKGYFVA